MIEGARWEIENISNIREGHTVQVSLSVKDAHLIGYVAKQAKNECSIDKVKNGYSVIFKCTVKEIRHLIDGSTKTLDTMVIMSPNNRFVEGVMMYMLHPAKCDPRFVQMIRGSVAANA